MRRPRYCVATSLDGFIAGPKGEFDWITMDLAIDFDRFYKDFDTVIMGRKTFEIAGGGGLGPDIQEIVCSRTMRPADHPKLTISNDAVSTVLQLKAAPGRDIWLFGGGELFRSLLDAKLVDTVELGIMPVLLGDGIPVLPRGSRSPTLRLQETKSFPSGIVSVSYNIEYAGGKKKGRPAKQRANRLK